MKQDKSKWQITPRAYLLGSCHGTLWKTPLIHILDKKKNTEKNYNSPRYRRANGLRKTS